MAEYQFSTFSTVQLIAAAFAVAISYLAWRRRSVPGSIQLTWLMLAVASWAFAYAFETASATASQNIFWAKAAYPGTHSVAPLFILLVLEYTQQREWLQRKKLALLWVIPIITNLLVFTNEYHTLIWRAITPNPDQSSLLIYHHGPWFWASTAYAYILLVNAAVFLFRSAIQISGQYRSQAIILILAIFPPWIANFLYIFHVGPFPYQELEPIAFVISGALLAWGMFHHRLFDLAPIAHRKLVDTMTDAVIMVDHQNQVGYINAAAQAIMQIPAEHVIGQPAHLVLSHWPYLTRRFEEGSWSQTEVKIITSLSGRTYDIRISKLTGQGSYNQGHLIILRDITEQRILEKELKASEELYRNVTTQSNDGIAIVQNSLVIYCNPQLADLMGRAIEEVENHALAALIAPDEVEIVLDRHIRRTRGEETPPQYRTALLHKSGHAIPVEFSISSIEINEQRCTLGMVRDIRSTLETEAEINRLAAVVKQADETVVITNLEGDIVYVNPQFEKISGYTYDEALGKNPRILKSGRQNPDVYQHLWDTLLSGKTWEGTLINKKKGGQIFHESTIIFPIKNQANQVTHYAAVKRDISAQVAADESLRTYARQQKNLNEITQATIEPMEYRQSLQKLSGHLRDLISADGCIITIWDDANQKVYLGANHGIEAQCTPTNLICQAYSTLTKISLTKKQPIAIHNVHETTLIAQDTVSCITASAVLVLPLYVDKKQFGAAILAFEKTHTFTDEEIEICQQASRQVALSMLKNDLLETAERRAQEAETLHLAGRAVTTSLNLEDAIEHILNELNRVVPHDSASVQLIDGQQAEIIGQRGFPKDHSPLGYKFSIESDTPNAVVAATRRPYIIEDAPTQYETFRKPPHNHIRGWLGVPLLIRNRMIGLLALDSKEPGQFTENHARLANAFASQVAIVLENARLYEETRRLAITDSLTDTFDRHHFMTLSEREYQRASRYQRPLSLIMMDLDYFKQVNDTYGHLVGDQVLQTITKLCKDNLRETDIIGRYGGEEFTILLPETPVKACPSQADDDAMPSAETVSERLRQIIETTPIKTKNAVVYITISIGIAEISEDCKNITMLIDHADQALYQAKRGGRNQVAIWAPDKH